MKARNRFWEVDSLRGLAILTMIFYHFMWDLNYFGLYRLNMLSGFWQIFARCIASTFLFVVGLSLTLSHNSYQQRKGHPPPFHKYLLRGGKIFGWGLLITLITYFFIGRGFVIFGILHLIGVSIVLAYPFLRWDKLIALLAGLVVLNVGFFLNQFVVRTPWLIWLGIVQAGRYMVDYYPLLPWFSLTLFGIFAGYAFYPGGERQFSLPNWSQTSFLQVLQFLGRHSLFIYLIHQPILISIFLMLGYGTF